MPIHMSIYVSTHVSIHRSTPHPRPLMTTDKGHGGAADPVMGKGRDDHQGAGVRTGVADDRDADRDVMPGSHADVGRPESRSGQLIHVSERWYTYLCTCLYTCLHTCLHMSIHMSTHMSTHISVHRRNPILTQRYAARQRAVVVHDDAADNCRTARLLGPQSL